jgi:uncharacterized membrane protein YphA (DoxX/SURF4 family)
VGLAQFGGGLAVLTGILFRVGAAGIFVVMLGAVILVHLPHGFNIFRGGMEYALTELLIASAFPFSGPRSLFARPLASSRAAELVKPPGTGYYGGYRKLGIGYPERREEWLKNSH